MRRETRTLVYFLVAAVIGFVATTDTYAHCDTMNGPIIHLAKTALETGDITPLLKWVKPEYESELKSAFEKTLVVREKGPEAQDLADGYFLETFVRVHRAGEGAPYTGIKDEPLKPIEVLADKALESGSPDHMIEKITGHVASGIRERFNKALAAKPHADDSVEAGREFVEAYVLYVHYVEGIREAVMSAGHAHGGGTESPAEQTHQQQTE